MLIDAPASPPQFFTCFMFCMLLLSSSAEECMADQTGSFLVPIGVAVALGVLVLVVLAAYFYGRMRSQAAGYEHFG